MRKLRRPLRKVLEKMGLENLANRLLRRVEVYDFVIIEPAPAGPHVYDRTKQPRVGAVLLATILRDLGYKVRVYAEILAPIDWDVIEKCRVVGISTITVTACRAFEIADKARAMGKTVVFGGVHPSLVGKEDKEAREAFASGEITAKELADATWACEQVLGHCDFLIRGEGERTLVEFLETLSSNGEYATVQGLTYIESGNVIHNQDRPWLTGAELSELPAPDMTLIVGHEGITSYPVVTSRGCPFGCTFCSVQCMFGGKYRFRSIESVLDELGKIELEYAFIVDDNAGAIGRKNTMALCQGIIDRGIKLKWMAQVRADFFKRPVEDGKGGYVRVEDTEKLKLVEKAGLFLVFIGAESINDQTLKDTGKHQKSQDVADAVEIAHRYGMGAHLMFVVGNDADDRGTVKRTLEFLLDVDADSAQIFPLCPFPGTPDTKRLRSENRVVTRLWSDYDAQIVVFVPNNITALELQKQIYWAYRKFYSFKHGWRLRKCGRPYTIFFRFVGRLIIFKWRKNNIGVFRRVQRGQIRHLANLTAEDRRRIKGASLYRKFRK